jgi:uncharacterized protein YecT (DUF1311 family)
VLGQKNGCVDAESTAEQAECAMNELGVAEADMTLAFDRALESYVSTPAKKKENQILPKFDRIGQIKWEKRMRRDLRISQKAWLGYRESACGAVQEMYDTGTIAKVAVPLCMVEITMARTKFLRGYFGDEE